MPSSLRILGLLTRPREMEEAGPSCWFTALGTKINHELARPAHFPRPESQIGTGPGRLGDAPDPGLQSGGISASCDDFRGPEEIDPGKLHPPGSEDGAELPRRPGRARGRRPRLE